MVRGIQGDENLPDIPAANNLGEILDHSEVGETGGSTTGRPARVHKSQHPIAERRVLLHLRIELGGLSRTAHDQRIVGADALCQEVALQAAQHDPACRKTAKEDSPVDEDEES